MRLIDAEIQSKRLINYILERKETFARALEKGDNDFIFAMLMDYFDKQPTAYDVDKVVQQLDDRSTLSRPVGWSKFYQIILLKDAIKIVKDGGIC